MSAFSDLLVFQEAKKKKKKHWFLRRLSIESIDRLATQQQQQRQHFHKSHRNLRVFLLPHSNARIFHQQ